MRACLEVSSKQLLVQPGGSAGGGEVGGAVNGRRGRLDFSRTGGNIR